MRLRARWSGRRSWAPWLLTTPTKIKQNFYMGARVRSQHAALTGAWEGYQWDHHTLASQPHTVLCWLLDGCLSPWEDMRTYAAGSGDCFPQETSYGCIAAYDASWRRVLVLAVVGHKFSRSSTVASFQGCILAYAKTCANAPVAR